MPYLHGITRLAQLKRLDLGAMLLAQLPWVKQKQLDELAPTHLKVPSGSRIRVDYSHETPVLAVRLQEMFGLGDTPRLGGGRVSVLLHLLSPAHRPVQITQDLAAFWQGSYQGLDFLVNAAVLALAWLFLGRTAVRAALGARSRSLVATTGTAATAALTEAADAAGEAATRELAARREALGRLAVLDDRWRDELSG